MISILYFIYLTFIISYYTVNSTLELVHVFFRHGSRAPTEFELYPNDPYKDYWSNVGFGKLTNIGREQSLQLGKVIRKRYESFLPKYYNSEEVMTKSSPFNRTHETASLVLDAMFPSSNNSNVTYFIRQNEYSKDFEFRTSQLYCIAFKNELQRVRNSIRFQEFESKYTHLFDVVSRETNKSYKSLIEVFFLFQGLYSEKYINLTLPEWAENWYETMHNLSALEFRIENFNVKLIRLNGGKMLKQVITNMKNKSKNTTVPNNKKIFLYSGHDSNVVNILATMDMFKPHFPNYNAAIIIELHHDINSKKYYVKVFYVHHVNKEPTEMIIDICGNPCYLDKLEEITHPYIPVNYTKECESDVLLE